MKVRRKLGKNKKANGLFLFGGNLNYLNRHIKSAYRKVGVHFGTAIR